MYLLVPYRFVCVLNERIKPHKIVLNNRQVWRSCRLGTLLKIFQRIFSRMVVMWSESVLPVAGLATEQYVMYMYMSFFFVLFPFCTYCFFWFWFFVVFAFYKYILGCTLESRDQEISRKIIENKFETQHFTLKNGTASSMLKSNPVNIQTAKWFVSGENGISESRDIWY